MMSRRPTIVKPWRANSAGQSVTSSAPRWYRTALSVSSSSAGGQVAAVALGDTQCRCSDATAHVEDALPGLWACHLGHQIGVGVERLRQRLVARPEVAEVEAVAVEQTSVVGDQIEVRGDARRR